MKTPTNQTAFVSAPDKANHTVQRALPGIEPPPFAAKWPQEGTHPADVLARMLAGERLTQPSYGFHGWRLAAYVKELEYHGWQIPRADVPPPPKFKGTRPIRMYWLASDTIRAALTLRGGV